MAKLSRPSRDSNIDKEDRALFDTRFLLNWLLDFQHYEVAHMTDSDWAWAQHQFLCIAAAGTQAGPVTSAASLASMKLFFDSEAGRASQNSHRADVGVAKMQYRQPTRTEVRRVHAQVRRVLSELWPTRDPGDAGNDRVPANLRKFGRTMIPARIDRVYLSAGPRGVRRLYGAASRDLIWIGISGLLEEFGDRLRRCDAPGCGRLFVRERRQVYCSTSCSQRVRSAKWYSSHQEEARERRRRAYAREAKQNLPKGTPPTRNM